MIRTLVYIWCGLVFIAVVFISRKPKDRVEAALARWERQKEMKALE